MRRTRQFVGRSSPSEMILGDAGRTVPSRESEGIPRVWRSMEAAMTDAGVTWTDERVEILVKLWNEGLSASQIAAEIGGNVSRNAVIGKVHRLGLSGRVKAPVATQRSRKPVRP